jgi:hypothetical protein
MQHRFQKGHKLSEETKKKIGDRHRRSIKFNCDYCGKENERKPSAFNKTKNHFCNLECFGKYTIHDRPPFHIRYEIHVQVSYL